MSFTIIIPTTTLTESLEKHVLNLLENISLQDYVFLIIDSEFTKTDISHRQLKIFQNNANYGPNYSRNRGIDNLQTEFVVFLDSDDYIDLRVLQRSLELFQKFDYLKVVSCNIKFKDQDKVFFFDRKFDRKTSPIVNFCLGKIPQVCWNKIYRTDFLLNSNSRFIEDKIIGRDGIFTLQVLSNLLPKAIFHLNEVLVTATISSESLSRNRNMNRFVSFKKNLEIYSSSLRRKYFVLLQLRFLLSEIRFALLRDSSINGILFFVRILKFSKTEGLLISVLNSIVIIPAVILMLLPIKLRREIIKKFDY